MNSHLYRVYFRDGNQRLFEGEDIISVMNYLVYELVHGLAYTASDIVKIEEVKQ